MLSDLRLKSIQKSLLFALALVAIFISTGGCNLGIKHADRQKVTVNPILIKDYGKALFALDSNDLKKGLDSLSADFSFFIGSNPDPASIMQIKAFISEPFNRDLFQRYSQTYPDLKFLEDELTETFGNIKTTYPGFRVPEVYAYMSGLLYESPVSCLDSVLIIGLDMFLGRDFELYRAAGLPVYMIRRMEKEYIVPECTRQIAYSMVPENMQLSTFLDNMILHGKILYAMDRFLPETADSIKIGYTTGQMEWSVNHEKEIWLLFIDQQMLYRTDAFLLSRFIQDGPFTSGLPEGAPAMLGRWIGWQIVRSYMKKHPDTDLQQLFDLDDAQKILSLSGYKPKK